MKSANKSPLLKPLPAGWHVHPAAINCNGFTVVIINEANGWQLGEGFSESSVLEAEYNALRGIQSLIP